MTKQSLLKAILEYLDKNGKAPGYKAFEREAGISEEGVRKYFSSMTDATQAARELAKKSTKQSSDDRVFCIYAIRLQPKVWGKECFKEQNPKFDPLHATASTLYLYVGYSSKTPEARLEEHITGIHAGRKIVYEFADKKKSNRIVEEFTRRNLTGYSLDEIEKLEIREAKQLRKLGHAVYQN